MTDQVEVQVQGGVQIIRMTRPEKKNALTLSMYGAMADALEQGKTDPTINVQVILGSGGSFSSGNDLNDFLTLRGLAGTALERFLYALATSEKPVLAGVQGFAVGIGSTMLLHCDIVHAATDARFQFPFVNLGLIPEAGSSLLLPRSAGHQLASELLLLGEPFDATRAREAGMVNAITAPEDLEASILAVAAKLAAKPRAALRMTKALLRAEPEALVDRIQREARQFEERLTSAELREAIAAFMEKRAPDFSKC